MDSYLVLSIALAVISFMLVVQSLVAMMFIRKCRKKHKAINDAYYQLVGVDGYLPHDVGRICKARNILIEGGAN